MSLPNMKSPCKNCPFRKDTLKGWLGKERMAEILNANSFVCHKKKDLQCAGFMNLKGEESEFVRLANRFGLDTELKGRDLVFETKKQCIEHHSKN